MRRNTAKDNIIFKIVLHHFERLVCSEAVIDKNPWFLIRLLFSLGIKHLFNPVQADLRVSISRLEARKMPARGRVRSLYALIGRGWPDN